mmetsp:Transcript_21328/g.66912  ORF Transcript_21328/g.66912 Transcript_21328/m.66912 type:complete len:205 (+) Transcript_21328:3-617(+)
MASRAARRARKFEILQTARRVLQESPLVAVASVTRSDVPSLTRTRLEFREQEFRFKKLPNRLCALALDGSDRAFMRGLFRGDTYVVYPELPEGWDEVGVDAAQLAKKLLKALKSQDHVVVVGGALDRIPLYPSDLDPLSKMPSLYDLRLQVAQTLKAPLVKTASGLRLPLVAAARALAAPPRGLARALLARKAQLGDDESRDAA